MLKLPPQSIASWYKPENKRQVWLHNMFKLRREMQAVQRYAEAQDATLLEKWTLELSQHYFKIREMVPEWSGRVDTQAMNTVLELQQAGEFEQIPAALDDLQKSCNSCHQQFRAVTANLYRAPDFSSLQIHGEQPLDASMRRLSAKVNNIKISMQDGALEEALATLEGLRTGIDELGGLCENCHANSPKSYPDDAIKTSLDTLQVQLTLGSLKQQGQALGELAVGACAQCHGTHRIAYDARQMLNSSPGLIDLLRH